METVRIVCPNCKSALILKYHPAFTSYEQPSLVEELLEEDYNDRKCPACGTRILLTGQILIRGPEGIFEIDVGVDVNERRKILIEQGVISKDGQIIVETPVQSQPESKDEPAILDYYI